MVKLSPSRSIRSACTLGMVFLAAFASAASLEPTDALAAGFSASLTPVASNTTQVSGSYGHELLQFCRSQAEGELRISPASEPAGALPSVSRPPIPFANFLGSSLPPRPLCEQARHVRSGVLLS